MGNYQAQADQWVNQIMIAIANWSTAIAVASIQWLVAGLGIVVSLTGLVIASFTANRELGERAKGGIAVSVGALGLLYIGVAAANYSSHLFGN